MMKRTFPLTQSPDTSQSQLPFIRGNSRLAGSESHSPTVYTERKRNHMGKSQSVVVMRLGKTERDVKDTFEELYTVKRKDLLKKAIEIERSDSTKDQLHALESLVVSRLKVYNSLRLSRSRKESYLTHLQSALSNLCSSQPDISPSKTTLDFLDLRYKQAKSDLNREIDYTETLEKMIFDRKRSNDRKNQPIFALRRELQRLKLKKRDKESDFLRISMEFQSLSNTVVRTKGKFDQQSAFHTVKMTEKTTHFKRRTEFIELVNRQDDQKRLESTIKLKENEVKRLTKEMIAVQRAETMLENSKNHLELLKTFELRSETLLKGSGTSEIQSVLDYWRQVTQQKTDLEGSIAGCDGKLTWLKENLLGLIEERKVAFANTQKEVKFDDKRVDFLLEEIHKREKRMENRENKVKYRQIKRWEKNCSMIYVKFDGILTKVGGGGGSSDRDLMQLVAEVEAKLVEIVEKRTLEG